MNEAGRIDHRDRYYSRLRPSHRVAFEEWRLTGLVKPFGATGAHMTIANPWLFTPDRRLILNDSANLLKGWK